MQIIFISLNTRIWILLIVNQKVGDSWAFQLKHFNDVPYYVEATGKWRKRTLAIEKKERKNLFKIYVFSSLV